MDAANPPTRFSNVVVNTLRIAFQLKKLAPDNRTRI